MVSNMVQITKTSKLKYERINPVRNFSIENPQNNGYLTSPAIGISNGVSSSRQIFDLMIKTAVFLFCAGFLFLGLAIKAQAANCGDTNSDGVTDTTCVCGDTVMGKSNYTYTLPANLTTCTGNGLTFGTSSITIDGNGHTITGDGGSTDYGIYNSGKTHATTTNIIITNFGRGIYYMSSANYGSITNSTTTSNTYGIYLDSSASSTLTNNTANSNLGYGIYLSSSASSTLTGNTMSGNSSANLYVSGSYNNTIDITNSVEGKPVYYLYGTSTQIYDGDVVGNIGMFWCINCTNVTVRNATLSTSNYYGVYFNNTTSSTIQNITANSNQYGIYLDSSASSTLTNNTANSNLGYGIYIYSSGSSTLTNNTTNSNQYGIWLNSSASSTLTNNTANSNTLYGIWLSSSGSSTLTNNTTNSNKYGIYLSSSASSTLTNNTANSNLYGIYLASSNSNTLTGNTISNNAYDLYNTGTTNTYSSNQFSHNLTSKMLTFVEATRTKIVNDSISFDISMFTPQTSACPTCSYQISVSPSEIITSSTSSNQVTGSFTATKSGIYSLAFTVTDSSSNVTKRRMLFFVGTTSSQTIKYYLRGINPTHGQPAGTDSKSLLLAAPTSTEEWHCSGWVQNSPDEIPNYALANLSGINTYSWYKQSKTSGAHIGIERYVTYSPTVNSSSSVPAATTSYAWINRDFSGLNWGMDYSWSWYWLSLKLNGTNPYWTTFPAGEASSSYTDFTYQYAAVPAVKSVSNTNINLLSATAPATATSSVSIVLENPLSSATSTTLTLPGFSRPFLNSTSTIYSSATTTITASVAANATTSLDAVAMDMSSFSDSIDINISTWLTSGTYNKQWTAGSSTATSTVYTVGDLEANKYYNVKLDNVLGQNITGTDCAAGICLSNSSGKITFTYTGTYSDHTFDVQEGDNTAPVRSSGSPSGTLAWNSSSATLSLTTDENATCKYGTSVNTAYSSIANTFSTTGATTHSVSLTGLSSNNSYTYYVRCQDTVGNVNSDDYQISFSLAAVPGGSSSMPVEWNNPPKPPAGGFKILINNNVQDTNTSNVTLSLTGGSDTARMAISNFSSFRDAGQENYTTTKTWNLCQGLTSCPEGKYTVYVKFYAPWGTNSGVVSDTIIYKTITLEKNLKYGQISDNIRQLQIFLNSNPDTQLTKSGPGSPGKETNLFGILTKAAVIKFQEKYSEDILAPWGLTKGTGFVGKTTRAKINELILKKR